MHCIYSKAFNNSSRSIIAWLCTLDREEDFKRWRRKQSENTNKRTFQDVPEKQKELMQ